AVRWRARPHERGDSPVDAQARSRVRPHFHAHLVLGLAALAALGAHAGGRSYGAGGRAALGLAACTGLGLWTVLAYAWLPRRLARIERRALLPEDFAPRRHELHDRLFETVSGKSELVKKLFERV